MKSRLYECCIMHARLLPRAHRFNYRIFLLALDLDEIPALTRRLRLLRFERRGLLSFRETDYLPTHTPLHRASTAKVAPSAPKGNAAPLAPLKARVLAYLADHGVSASPDASVVLLSLPRVMGYQFNPVSFYFIRKSDGTALAAIAEVTNTFRETKIYLLGPATLQAPSSTEAEPAPPFATRREVRPTRPSEPLFRLRTPKFFYVSPFSDVDLDFDFRLRPPAEHLTLQIDDYAGPQRTLISTVTNHGPPRALTDAILAWVFLKYPLVTLKVIAAIHWEALRLWAKRVPWFAKSARSTDQRDLHHPHPSLVSKELSGFPAPRLHRLSDQRLPTSPEP
ncbi:MAG: DUF1365 domain-containing protein [Verrucomicrobia bacterium]|nr:MAG: DUF1365 domain-containing protein [Verrucomicrobiota bacterium]